MNHTKAISPQTSSSIAPSRAVSKQVHEAVRHFSLIAPGDRVAVGMSGGKDSAMLLTALCTLQRSAQYDFSIHPVHLDQHQPGFDRDTFASQQARLGHQVEVVSKDTHSIVQAKLKPGQIPCAICGRLRRGILNSYCAEQGYTKLALGHHLDDALETFFLNLFYGRRLDPLKPATPASAHEVTTIRPLILVEERKILAWALNHDIPVVACPVCDTVPESRRRDIKALMRQFSGLDVDIYASVRDALYDTRPPRHTDAHSVHEGGDDL